MTEMMTKAEVMGLVAECEAERKKTVTKPHYYIRGGVVRERSYPDRIETERYKELFHHVLRSEEAKIFKCGCCGKMVGYFDLERFECDFNTNDYICDLCYEEAMGEDL